jgi:uncharacterized membrane protein HdeD (DUF308 family)
MVIKWLLVAAAVSTFIAGVLHLTLVSNSIGRNPWIGIFFLVGGIAQIFWVLPTIKNWGRIWFYIGIAGTLVLIIMWAMTRMPDNPITGRGAPINNIGVATEIFQIIYIATSVVIILNYNRTLIFSKNSIKDSKR